VSKAGAGGQTVRVLLAEDPFEHGDQCSELVPGPGRVTLFPGPAGQVGKDDQGVRVFGPKSRPSTGTSAANWSRARAGLPAHPVQKARFLRTFRMFQWSGSKDRS
jgi:hypothetical protein